ncbi:uncharacterized protein LOC131857648 [Cryptomeria japonica]|uniref:uncharacterized protein LOC131857648 n=1 Tax=Cryptomeria japonica TaxID=3369 RepID=UPI0027DA42A6|nr:uncharacterized protein LOC131857648 [Cryptomeria japonica]
MNAQSQAFMVQNDTSYQDAGVNEEPKSLEVAMMKWQGEEFCGVNQPQAQNKSFSPVVANIRSKKRAIDIGQQATNHQQEVVGKDKGNLFIKEEHYESIHIFKDKLLKIGKVCTPEERHAFVLLCQEFNDIFAWRCEYLKGFDPHLAQHTIELVENSKPVRQKQRPLNRKLEHLMKIELDKLVHGNIIFLIKHTSRVSNLVFVRKKNGELRLCVDFRDLNRASLKDHYLLPSMEQNLQVVSGSETFSLLDGYSGYNQILVKEEDQYKTKFITKWGTMAYNKMPFGLSNVGATFQHAMDMAFHGLINKFVLVYLDDVTFFSKNVDQHLDHLRQIFERCREYGISLNPKESIFTVHEGRLQDILFLNMWTKEGKNNFEEIKEAIAATPTLINHNFEKYFILYAFGSEDIISTMLCQQNYEGQEQPIDFFSQILHDYETRYSFVDKHVLAIIRSLKKFRHMLSNNKIQLMVSHPTVKEFLLTKDINDKRARWITKAMECDISIKVTKLVRGKGLCEQLARSIERNKEEEQKIETTLRNEEHPVVPPVPTTWNQQIAHYLQTGDCSEDYNSVLLRCIKLDQIDKVLQEFHERHAGGHFAARTIALKIMRVGYYWPDLFKDAHSWVRKCEKCSLFVGKQRLATLPLQPIEFEQCFAKWGLDFIGPINLPSSACHKWILIATDYFKKWTEAVPLKEANETFILNFYQDLVSRFGTPKSIISDNALAFIGLRVLDWSVKHNIYLNTLSNYYPQGNRQVESTNKNLINIIKKTIVENQRTWHEKLKLALWADRITHKPWE